MTPRKVLLLLLTCAAVVATAVVPIFTLLRVGTVILVIAGGLWLIAVGVYGIEYQSQRRRFSWWRRS